MVTSKELNYGLLAELSYVNFDFASFGNSIEAKVHAKGLIETQIEENKRKEPLKDLLSTYEIVDFKSTSSGMQALLLKDSSGHYTIAYRGTETNFSGLFQDLLVADILGMGLKVVPKFQFMDALDVTSQWMGTYNLNSSNTTVSGHSLGGGLAQLSSYTFGFEAYTYNAFGFDAATSGYRTTANAMLSVLEDTSYRTNALKNISNIYNFFAMGEDYQDVISGGLTELVDGFDNGHIGEAIPIKTYTGGAIGSHSSSVLNDSIQIYNNIMSASNISDYNYLTRLFDSYDQIKESQVIDTLKAIATILGEDISSSVQEIAQSIANDFSNLKIESFVGKSATELSLNTQANIYALLHLNHFKIDGNYNAYDTINPDDYSDIFLANRADYLYYTLDKHNRYDVVRGLQDYKDISLGEEYDLSKGANVGKVLFGGDIDNTSSQMQGSSERDYLFGMAGDDTIVGNAGNDYLEGGKGFDTLQGGSNYDTYITDNGDILKDDLEGKGIVYFEGELLSGGTKDAGSGCNPQSDGSEVYKGNGGKYTLKDSILTFAKDGKILTINDFQKRDGGYIGITLKDNEGDGGSCSNPESGDGGSGDGDNGGNGESGSANGSCPKPINPIFNFNFSLPTPLQPVTSDTDRRDEESTYSEGGSEGGGGSYTPHTYTPTPTPVIECVNSPVYHSTGVGGGSSTGPIVLDLNRDSITLLSF
ncbi:MAG: hypothetical protein AABY36_00295 [Campylobacterota bacterium]